MPFDYLNVSQSPSNQMRVLTPKVEYEDCIEGSLRRFIRTRAIGFSHQITALVVLYLYIWQGTSDYSKGINSKLRTSLKTREIDFKYTLHGFLLGLWISS